MPDQEFRYVSRGDRPTVGAGLEPGLQLGKLKLIECLGHGGLGEVWKAYDPTRDGCVALKFLPPLLQHSQRELKRMQETFRAVQALQHPHICPVYFLEEFPPYGYALAMKFVDGVGLLEYRDLYVEQHGEFPLEEVVRILRPVAAALDYAHNPAAVHPEITRPVIHRDIKPENILIGRDGRGVQIVDFGLAAQVRISLSRTSQVEMDSVGTLPYMAPEQWRGQYQDAKTDQYALGVVAYELLADRLPFETADPVQLRECVLHDPVPPIRGQTPQVNAVLARAMAKAREDRWPTCVAFVDALARQPALLVAPFSAAEARTAQDAWAAHLGQPVEFEISPGLWFRLIPPGEFLMGSTEADLEKLLRMYPNAKREWYTDELPQHRVRITRSFWLGRYQVTRGQFAAFVRETGYKTEGEADGRGGWSWNSSTGKWEQDPKITWRTPGFDQTDEHPVLVVSWNDAKAYCAWLSKRTGKTVRLPTEAEWEFACRAGTTTWYYSGDDPETLAKVGNVADGTAKKRFPNWETIVAEDGYVVTAPVGKFQPNAFGLYDMHGNAWDWTEDRHSSDYYQQVAGGIVEDPTGPPDGSSRVVRGGSWFSIAGYCRSAYRHPSSIRRTGTYFIGIRLVVSWD